MPVPWHCFKATRARKATRLQAGCTRTCIDDVRGRLTALQAGLVGASRHLVPLRMHPLSFGQPLRADRAGIIQIPLVRGPGSLCLASEVEAEPLAVHAAQDLWSGRLAALQTVQLSASSDSALLENAHRRRSPAHSSAFAAATVHPPRALLGATASSQLSSQLQQVTTVFRLVASSPLVHAHRIGWICSRLRKLYQACPPL